MRSRRRSRRRVAIARDICECLAVMYIGTPFASMPPRRGTVQSPIALDIRASDMSATGGGHHGHWQRR
jgi:hypothetical protein